MGEHVFTGMDGAIFMSRRYTISGAQEKPQIDALIKRLRDEGHKLKIWRRGCRYRIEVEHHA